MKTTTQKSIFWARVSTKEQAEEGYSLSSQIKLMRDYAERKGMVVAKEFIVPESASGKQERKHFQEMLEYLKKHPEIKFVICEKVDRISRNFKDAVKLDDWLNEDEERQIHFVKQSLVIHKNAKSHEKFQWDIYLVLARNYSNNLSEETKKGLDEKNAGGWYAGNQKRGYRTIGDIGHKIWAIDDSLESEARFIKLAFELYDSGEYTTKTLGKRLFEEGWRSSVGKPISKSEMHKLLSDCFYCGEFMWKGVHEKNAKHPPLISKELFYRVQERMTRKLTGKYRKHEFLFQNIVCGECGRSVVGDIRKGHIYYHCTRHETNCTQRQYTRQEVLEKQISEFFEALEVKNERVVEVIRKALKESHADEMEYHNKTMSELNRQYTLLQNRLDMLYDDKLDSRILPEMYDRKFKQYSEEQTSILASIERHKAANINYFDLGVKIFELSQRAREIYAKSATMAEKRSLLGFVFSNLQLKDKKLIPAYANAFELVASRAETGNWLPDLDSNQDTRLQRARSYH